MTTFKLLSSAQVNFLNLVFKQDNYLGKATLPDGKTIKLYSFRPSALQYKDYTEYLSEQEYQDLVSLQEQYVFSPYYRLIIRSLKDLVETKKLTLNFKHQFYNEIPKLLGDFSHLSLEQYKGLLIDLNNSFQHFRCRSCGHALYMSGCDCYFEYYSCINTPNCNYNIRVN